MQEVEEPRPRGMRRMSPFGEIGMESELAELGRQTILPSAALAVTERDEESLGDEGSVVATEVRAAVPAGDAPDETDEFALGGDDGVDDSDDADEDV